MTEAHSMKKKKKTKVHGREGKTCLQEREEDEERGDDGGDDDDEDDWADCLHWAGLSL